MSDIPQGLKTALAERYTLESHLGEGGMATVYLANDLKHDRKVALKVLKPELAAIIGGERFVNEIKVTANLQHPNILPLYDSGVADTFLYYVMPYIEGESLRDKLDREKQLGVEEAIEIAKSVAGALDYAHEQGIVHRDIKPENILLQRGQALVADFGIALAVSHAGGTRLTETGLSLGTPHYMSPEQATGDRELDARSDVYSLGAMVYEMLVGEPPHLGGSVQAVVAKILTDDAEPLTKHRHSVPPHVDAAVRKSLDKTPADRFSTAAQFAEALTNTSFTLPPFTGAAEVVPLPAATRSRRLTYGAVGIAVATVALLAWSWTRPTPSVPLVRNQIVFGADTMFTNAFKLQAAVAPDGSGLVFSEGPTLDDRLLFKPRDEVITVPLSGTEGGISPFFSPDGAWIGFISNSTVRKVPTGGGASLTLADSATMLAPAGAWLDDGTIVFVDVGFNLRRVSDAGGSAEILVSREQAEQRFIADVWGLPGARGILFTACLSGCPQSDVFVYDIARDTATKLFEDAQGVWYAPTGHVLYVSRAGGLFAAAFDTKALELTGPAIPIIEDVRPSEFTVAVDGTALYRVGPVIGSAQAHELVWIDRDGGVTAVDRDWTFDAGGGNAGWTISPDGTRIALRLRTEAGLNVWIKELPNGPLSRLTFAVEEDRKPRWSTDGRNLFFLSDRDGPRALYSKPADGTGIASLVYEHEVGLASAVVSPDERWLILRTAGVAGIAGGRDISAVELGVDSVPTPLLAADFDESAPALSPDGNWLAYISNETGRYEVYIRPFPDVESGRWQISTGGGHAPVWAHSGTELFYRDPEDQMIAARIGVSGTRLSVGERRVLFRLAPGYLGNETLASGYFDVTADDQRFLLARPAGLGDLEDADAVKLILVQNWFEELKAKTSN